ncbi:MAG: cytochrome c [Chloroflexia bacterium]|nr:cytochrome c [Chloroflexia bacterium]
MNMPVRYRQRFVVLIVFSAVVMVAAMMPFLGQAQDTAPAPTETELIETGEDIYANVCIACHQPGGEGIQNIFPALSGNPLLTGDDPSYFIEVLLNGRGGMPRFSGYDDTEIAGITTYVRQAWDNDAGVVSPEQVAAIRDTEPVEAESATPDVETQSEAVGNGDATPEDGTPIATPEE